MDILLEGEKTGFDAAREISEKKPTPIIYLTGNVHLLDGKNIKTIHPFAVLTKPFADFDILGAVEQALSKQ